MKRVGKGAEILSIASNETEEAGYCIVVATYDSHIQVWIVDSLFDQKIVFSIQLNMLISCALTFAPDGSQNIIVFSLEDGSM